jgi:hypothetical protein
LRWLQWETNNVHIAKKVWDSAAICYELDSSKGHVVGTVMRKVTPRGKVKKACHSYEITWEFTGLGMSIMEVPAVVEGINKGEQLVAERLRAEKDTISNKCKPSRAKGQKLNATSVHNKLCEVSDNDGTMEALPSESSECGSDKNDSDTEWELFDTDQAWFNTHQELESDELGQDNDSPTAGLHWEVNGTISNTSNKKMPPRSTTVRPGSETLFGTPIQSMMTMFPLLFCKVIITEVNRYASQKLSNKKDSSTGNKRKLIGGYKWQTVTLNEIITYFGILIYGMLFPQTGGCMRDAWESLYHNAWTKFMSKGRFLQITSVLHFNDNDDVDGKKSDSLHKIRPLFNIMKKKHGKVCCMWQ